MIFLNGVTDRPMTYLYNTLHYYEKRLKDRPPLKKKLVSAIIGTGLLGFIFTCCMQYYHMLLMNVYSTKVEIGFINFLSLKTNTKLEFICLFEKVLFSL